MPSHWRCSGCSPASPAPPHVARQARRGRRGRCSRRRAKCRHVRRLRIDAERWRRRLRLHLFLRFRRYRLGQCIKVDAGDGIGQRIRDRVLGRRTLRIGLAETLGVAAGTLAEALGIALAGRVVAEALGIASKDRRRRSLRPRPPPLLLPLPLLLLQPHPRLPLRPRPRLQPRLRPRPRRSTAAAGRAATHRPARGPTASECSCVNPDCRCGLWLRAHYFGDRRRGVGR